MNDIFRSLTSLGKSQADLDKFAAELKKKEADLGESQEKLYIIAADLKKKEAEISQKEENAKHEREILDASKATFEQERSQFREQMKTEEEQLAQAKADLEKRRAELIRLEAEAKAGFARAQEEAFRKVIEKRLEDLDKFAKGLDERAKSLEGEMAKVNEEKGRIAKRELEITAREQQADAGFADKAAALAAEAKRQLEANQREASRLKEKEETLAAEWEKLEKAKAAVHARETKVSEDERKRDAGYIDERTRFDAELAKERQEWLETRTKEQNALRQTLTEQRTTLFAALDEDIEKASKERLAAITVAEEKERERIRQCAEKDAKEIREKIENERKAWETEKERQQDELKKQYDANEKKAGELSAKESHLEGLRQEHEANERHLETQLAKLEDIIEERVEERKDFFDAQLAESREVNEQLLASLKSQAPLVGKYEQFKVQFGEDLAEVLHRRTTQMEEILRLRQELEARPTDEVRERRDILEKEVKDLKSLVEKLQTQLNDNQAAVSESVALRFRNQELETENRTLQRKAELMEADRKQARDELERLRKAYERPAEVASRYKEIEMPLVTIDKINRSESDLGYIDELTWLKGIGEACDEYGLHFPERILKAFHTALKTAEWSPITILAGVSGTGKSELPRLYSHFGGFMFEPLSVQPNWDSQESMLGFFNSIDNKFDAQPILRFLAQSQQAPDESYEDRLKRWQGMAGRQLILDPEDQAEAEIIQALKESNYPGLNDCLNMVLLDEMNLAHPELYFAEFLSKLESRRGKTGADLRKGALCLDVKIGAGLPPYQLPLGRNVLWVGTMNQDETTKSLSDKVLDRSIIIYFPRPTDLKRRVVLTPLNDKNRSEALVKMGLGRYLISKDAFWGKREKGKLVYKGWCVDKSTFTYEQIKPFKSFIESINEALGKAGRAIGHRVWQSVEYYMANYPDVRAALDNEADEAELQQKMHVAFEDQLVQKVMPKLRGIDTRGTTRTECLDAILSLLDKGIGGNEFHLHDDFEEACNLGYGQFMWQSANYLRETDEGRKTESHEEENADTDAQSKDEADDSTEEADDGKKKRRSRKKD